MAFNSSIEWTDATWNPVRGCTKISPGCAALLRGDLRRAVPRRARPSLMSRASICGWFRKSSTIRYPGGDHGGSSSTR